MRASSPALARRICVPFERKPLSCNAAVADTVSFASTQHYFGSVLPVMLDKIERSGDHGALKRRRKGVIFRMSGTLIFGSQTWLALVAALVLPAIALVVWRSRGVGNDGWGTWLGPLFKIVALLLLGLCLLEPLWSGQRARPGANLFLILADDSQSLTMKDPGTTVSRGEHVKRILSDEESPWQVRLAQDFDVRKYVFNSGMQSASDFSRLDFTGSQTRLFSILNGLKDRFRDRPLAGVLLFTDGIATDSRELSLETTGLPPIYPVVLGAESAGRPIPDLAVSHVTITTTAFEDAPVTIQADVSQTSLPKAKVTAQVIDEEGAVISEVTQAFSGEPAPLPFRFQIRPKKPGISFYEVRVRTEEEAKRATATKQATAGTSSVSPSAELTDRDSVESTLANNRRLVAVDRGSSKYRILYLSGRPNWEYKFLRRAIESDEQVQLTGVIRIAKKEPKFDWRSKAGEVSNPLFRGFEGKTEETERYDQPVLVRLNTKTPDELAEGFPKTADELYQFHAVIIDDLEAEFFSPDQLALLERLVSERGGGLLMLGGSESFRQGGYGKTPVGRMLPISLDAAAATASPEGYRLLLTREGWLQPWARLRSTETEEQQRLIELPNFLTLNRAGHVKPGSTVIAEVVESTGSKQPALAVQAFGRGRCAAMLIGDLWRWQLNRTDVQREKDDLGKAWRQTIRWLIADVPDRIELRTLAKDDLGQPLMQVEARIRTKEFQPQDNATVNISVHLPDGVTVTQPAEPSLREAGLYESTFASRLTGKYRTSVEVIDHEGQPLGNAETGWVADSTADEFARVVPNIDLLTRIAQQTSGEVIKISDLDTLVRSLPHREAPLTEAYTVPIWHQPWMMALIVGLLCAEWGLRRWKGLP